MYVLTVVLHNHLRLWIPDFDLLKYSHPFPMIWVFICVHMCVKVRSPADSRVGSSLPRLYDPWPVLVLNLHY